MSGGSALHIHISPCQVSVGGFRTWGGVLAAPTVEHLALHIPSVPGTPLALFSFLSLCGGFPVLAREQWVSWEEVSVEGVSTGFRTKCTQTLGSPAHWLDGKSSQLQELQSLQLYNGRNILPHSGFTE